MRQPERKEIVTSKDTHEITLVNINYLFPIRFLKDVAFLREKYAQRITSNEGEQARRKLHLEGTVPPFLACFSGGGAEEEVSSLPTNRKGDGHRSTIGGS
jgi:hypothetical protein